MVSSGGDQQSSRARLGFRQEALSVFAFLTADYDFSCTHADPNLLTYESEILYVDVYRDPLSYEVGVDHGKLGHDAERKRSFSLVELMRLENPRKAANFRYPAIVTADQMRPALVNLAELLKTYGGSVLRGDLSVLKRVRRESARFERDRAKESRLHPVRSRANAAFREKDYTKAVALYESINVDLSPAESRKLEYSKKRMWKPGPREE